MKTLIVIDMQNDFIDGSLGTPEAVDIVENVKAKIKEAEANGDRIIFTRDTHQENYLETNEGKHLPVSHCIYQTDGWQLVPEVKMLLKGAEIVDKPTFGSVTLAEMLKMISETEPIEIELCGLCTDICVVSNALLLKAFMPGVEISVDASCCAGTTPQKHQAALETMQSCQINII